MIDREHITGLVLAGGRGSRMGGVDKGLQRFHGQALAAHALARLAPQVGTVMINANRHLELYRSMGVPVWPDILPNHPGPLAGFLAGLMQCKTPYLASVPCDSPLFPLDVVAGLAQGLLRDDAQIAVAATRGRDVDGGVSELQLQPVFCLIDVRLRDDLERFIHAGHRKIELWTTQQCRAIVRFERDGDAQAFTNVNTLSELQALQSTSTSA